MELDQYRSVLLRESQEPHKITMRTLRLTRDKHMARYSIEKTGLTDLFFKLKVADDAITCTPLELNGSFL